MSDTIENLDLAPTCQKCRVRGSALCRALVKAGLPGVRQARTRTVSLNSTVMYEGDTPEFLGVLRSGYLRKETVLRDGQRTIFGLASPGDLVGGFLGKPMTYTLEAATDAEICVFDKHAVDQMMTNDLSFKRCVMREVWRQHDRQLEQVWRRGALTSRERIIAFLVSAVDNMPSKRCPDRSVVLTMDLSRRDWADFSNTTVETISRTLRYLADKDLVTRIGPSRYLIRDLNRLAYLAGIDADIDQQDAAKAAKKVVPMTAINAAAPGTRKTDGVQVATPQIRGRFIGSRTDGRRQVRH